MTQDAKRDNEALLTRLFPGGLAAEERARVETALADVRVVYGDHPELFEWYFFTSFEYLNHRSRAELVHIGGVETLEALVLQTLNPEDVD